MDKSKKRDTYAVFRCPLGWTKDVGQAKKVGQNSILQGYEGLDIMIKTYRRSKEHKLHLLCRVCFADLEHDTGVIFEDKNDKYGLVVPLCDDCKRILMDKMREIICYDNYDVDELRKDNNEA